MPQHSGLSCAADLKQPEQPPTESPRKEPKPLWGLVRRRQRWGLSWRGRFLLLLICLGLAMIVAPRVSSFLATSAPIDAEVLVVEGWAPDYALEAAISEFKQHPYARFYVVGGPILAGAPLSEYKTYAELGAATVMRLGLNGESVQAVPAPKMRKDRTYTSAIALRDWLRQHG